MWKIFNNSILDNMEISDCNDTIQGICLTNKSLEECMDLCKGDCSVGVFFDFKQENNRIYDSPDSPDSKTICVPIRTDNRPALHPVYRIKNQSIYNLDPDYVEVTTFIDTNKWTFPPDLANVIFHGDIINLSTDPRRESPHSPDSPVPIIVDIENVLKLGPGLVIGNEVPIKSNIQINTIKLTANPVKQNSPIIYGAKIFFSILGTSFIMNNQNNTLMWTPTLSKLLDDDIQYFTIKPTRLSGKKVGDLITYSDTFLIMYLNIGFVAYNKLKRNYNILWDISNIDLNEFEIQFKCIPQKSGYFCHDGNTCKSVLIKDTIPVMNGRKFEDSLVFLQKNCFNLCRDAERIPITSETPQTTDIRKWINYVLIILIISCSLYIFFKTRNGVSLRRSARLRR